MCSKFSNRAVSFLLSVRVCVSRFLLSIDVIVGRYRTFPYGVMLKITLLRVPHIINIQNHVKINILQIHKETIFSFWKLTARREIYVIHTLTGIPSQYNTATIFDFG